MLICNVPTQNKGTNPYTTHVNYRSRFPLTTRLNSHGNQNSAWIQWIEKIRKDFERMLPVPSSLFAKKFDALSYL